MPLIYGEGYKAFVRLQEEIIRSVNDLSIFCWTWDSAAQHSAYSGFLALSPDDFASVADVDIAGVGVSSPEFTITNKGIRITAPLEQAGTGSAASQYTLILSLNTKRGGTGLGVYVKHYGGGMYLRMRPDLLATPPRLRYWKPTATPSVRYLTKAIHLQSDTRVSSVMNNAFLFKGDWSTQHCTYVSTTPAVWWDQDHKIFLRDGGAPFVAFHVFKADWDTTMQETRFIIAFGVSKDGEEEKPWFRVASDHTYPVLLGAALRGDLEHIQTYGPLDWQASSNELLWLERRSPTPLPSAGNNSSRLAETTYETWHAAISFSLTTGTLTDNGSTHNVYKLKLENTGAMRTE